MGYFTLSSDKDTVSSRLGQPLSLSIRRREIRRLEWLTMGKWIGAMHYIYKETYLSF